MQQPHQAKIHNLHTFTIATYPLSLNQETQDTPEPPNQHTTKHTNNYSSEHVMNVIELINQNNDSTPFKPIGTLDVEHVTQAWLFRSKQVFRVKLFYTGSTSLPVGSNQKRNTMYLVQKVLVLSKLLEATRNEIQYMSNGEYCLLRIVKQPERTRRHVACHAERVLLVERVLRGQLGTGCNVGVMWVFPGCSLCLVAGGAVGRHLHGCRALREPPGGLGCGASGGWCREGKVPTPRSSLLAGYF